ncbi:MAG: hypothetical protein LQ349_008002 [Xanthoria aureola]|nr:MAG: hypothetical protein LQ349_008002 [Xanthoria aureola]
MSLEVAQPEKESVTHYNQHYDGKETINGPAYQTLNNKPAPCTSRAQHPSRSIENLRQQLKDSADALERYMLDSNNSSNITSRTANLSDIKPASNCSEIGDNKTYISAFQKMPFTVHCETDYPGFDILGVWMFTFADCMEACASWNAFQHSPRCYSVSYDPSDTFTEEAGFGNCFFKGERNIQARHKTEQVVPMLSFLGTRRMTGLDSVVSMVWMVNRSGNASDELETLQ